jgi:preprotein translocase subunit SecA
MAAVLSNTWHMLDQRVVDRPLAKGLDAVWDAGVGLAQRCVPRQRRFLERAETILRFEKQFSDMSNAQLREAIEPLREIFRRQRDTREDLDRAFAVIREVAMRQIGERPFPVQIAGALALEAGCVVEMATGEGKTLTATMPATVAGWRGRGCHIITVNDYLAKRDAEWMGRIYHFCGLKVGHVEQGMLDADRRAAYAADITYCTNKEVTADFLRDRLVLGRCGGLSAALLDRMAGTRRPVIDALVQRGLHYAIVDEADSILIDEAVTPLIISGPGPNPEQTQAFRQAAGLAAQLRTQDDYHVDVRHQEVELTEAGKQRIAELCAGLGGLWGGARRRQELIVKALTAQELYRRDHQYVVEGDKVVIVDEFTGRLMPDRQWRDGLHQAVEAKEQIEVTPPKETYARISFQRFFRMYGKLAGMTGTAQEATAEFWQIYHLPVVVIPTNRACIRQYLPDLVFPNEAAKWKRIVEEIVRVHATGRPILVGTRSVRASEFLSRLLTEQGLEHRVLNAVHHREEAQIVAQAGQHGWITVATNMAGRGTDIKLGPGIAQMGGLHVLATERNESGRIDRQLFGRCARQGDPGSAQAIVSLEDEFVSRYAKTLVNVLKRRYGAGEDENEKGSKGQKSENVGGALAHADDPGEAKEEQHGPKPIPRLTFLFRYAQWRADRLALRRRKSVIKTDHWLDDHLSFAGRE